MTDALQTSTQQPSLTHILVKVFSYCNLAPTYQNFKYILWYGSWEPSIVEPEETVNARERVINMFPQQQTCDTRMVELLETVLCQVRAKAITKTPPESSELWSVWTVL
jgi:hypothetical protein